MTPELILVEVSQVLSLENCWNFGACYLMGSRSVGWMFDDLGLTNGFAQRLFGYLNDYIEGVLKMSDYSRSSNEFDSWSGFGMRCTLEIG